MVIFTTDTVTNAFDSAEGDGITVDADEQTVDFSWNEIPVVRIDSPPYEKAFETDEFYKIEDVTTARPIIQYYRNTDGNLVKRQKPAEELDKAAWSFNNKPYTIGHPDTGVVKDVNDVHGFWRDPYYDHDEERKKETLYVPTNDDEAIEYIEENPDVSVGFYNERVSADAYSGDVGSLTDEEPEEYQTNIFGDHIASVPRGRCSSAEGCGVMADSSTSFGTKKQQTKQESGEDYDPSEYSRMNTDYREGDTYYAIAPDENADEEPKYRIENCNDATDAWNLRGAGDYDIDQSTLESRIKSRADELGCDLPDTAEEDADAGCGCGPEGTKFHSDHYESHSHYYSNRETTMSNDDDTNGFDISVSVDSDSVTIDSLAEQIDAVAELKEDRDSLAEDVSEYEADFDEMREVMDLDADECPCDHIEDVVDEAERVEELEEDLEQYREEERQEALDELTSTYRADEDDWEDAPLDEIEAEIDRRAEIFEDSDMTLKTDGTASNDGGDNDETQKTRSGKRKVGRGYAAGRN